MNQPRGAARLALSFPGLEGRSLTRNLIKLSSCLYGRTRQANSAITCSLLKNCLLGRTLYGAPKGALAVIFKLPTRQNTSMMRSGSTTYIFKLPTRQNTVGTYIGLNWIFSKLPTRQNTCKRITLDWKHISKLPTRQNTLSHRKWRFQRFPSCLLGRTLHLFLYKALIYLRYLYRWRNTLYWRTFIALCYTSIFIRHV